MWESNTIETFLSPMWAVYSISCCTGVNLKSKIVKVKWTLAALEYTLVMITIFWAWMDHRVQLRIIVCKKKKKIAAIDDRHYSSEIRFYWSFYTNAWAFHAIPPLPTFHFSDNARCLFMNLLLLLFWFSIERCKCTGNY